MKTSFLLLAAVVLAGLTGCNNSSSPAAAASDSPPPLADGKLVYGKYCATCHMEDGSGVPDMQPALPGSDVIKGDPKTLVRMILQGPETVLPPDKLKYSNAMPAFGMLSDDQTAAVATYLRHEYGGGASGVTAKSVAAIRAEVK